jgi:hypothetical protein
MPETDDPREADRSLASASESSDSNIDLRLMVVTAPHRVRA